MIIEPGMRLHFMGVGGIGMSGLAQLCKNTGCVVSGCDVKANALSHRLHEQGVRIWEGHDASHLKETPDVVIYSSAVSSQESELCQARSHGIAVISRGELLAALAKERRLIAVAGAHGKTTTSAMAAGLLSAAGWDPTISIGGLVRSLNTNAHLGKGTYMVAETDESDGSFLHLTPLVAIVTNIDREHLNHYGSFENLRVAFQQFVGQIAAGGSLIRCVDDPVVRSTLSHPSPLSYGLSSEADVWADRVCWQGTGSRFEAWYKGRALGTFRLQVPGRHNVLNALATISLALILDIPMVTAKEALASFQGTQRRFQVLQLPGDIWFVEDYAHHPAEIHATLCAGRGMGRHRLVVFQPHRFSRTQSLEKEFINCFDYADGLIVTDIYPAFEQPIAGVSGERLAGLIKAHGHPWVRYVPNSEVIDYVSRVVRSGDTVFFLGAGDIGDRCHELADRLHSPQRITG